MRSRRKVVLAFALFACFIVFDVGGVQAKRRRKRRKTEHSVEIETDDEFADDTVATRARRGEGNSPSQEEEEERSHESFEKEDDEIDVAATPKATRKNDPTSSQNSNYLVESAMVCLAVVYVTNYFYGKSQNNKIAEDFARNAVASLQSQFAAVGIHSDHSSKGLSENDRLDGNFKSLLVKEHVSCYKLYASGRRYCKGVVVTLDLMPRQELFSVILGFVQRWDDVVRVEVPMNEADMSSLVFVLCPRTRRAQMREFEDVSKLCKEVKSLPSAMPTRLSVMTDCADAVPALLKDDVLSTVSTFHRQIRYVHFTDRVTVDESREEPLLSDRYLRFEFSGEDVCSNVSGLLKLVTSAIDGVGRLKLSKASLKASAKKRSTLTKKSNKDTIEEERQMILEKRQEDKEIARRKQYDSLKTDEQRRKWEEKEEKRKRKKAMKKMRGKMTMRRG